MTAVPPATSERTGLSRRLIERVLYSGASGRFLLYPITSWGYWRYRRTGVTPVVAYRAMRKLYGSPQADLFQRVVRMVDRQEPPLILDEAPAGIASGEIEQTVVALERDGYAVLHARLGEDICTALEECARQSVCSLVPYPTDPPFRDLFRETAPRAIRYDLDESDIVCCPGAQGLIADASLLAIAYRYLGSPPVQDLNSMWWSTASGPVSSAAAQEFHFDVDRLRFLKVFVYLTDVDERSGPHVYVRGTHRDLPARFREDRRYRDSEVLPSFEAEATTILGPRGTVFLADTRGLHKGQSLLAGHRLVFQTEYATSLFGHPFECHSLASPTPGFIEMRKRYPFTFQRYSVGTT